MWWCFIDESWHEGKSEHAGVLAAVVGPQKDFEGLAAAMFRFRAKYYSREHACDLRLEIKGKELFSNFSFKMGKTLGYSKNLTIAREIIEWTKTTDIRIIGITVYGKTAPPLMAPDSKHLSQPFLELCVRVQTMIPKNDQGLVIFDQRLGAQEDISIAVCHYLAGIPEPRRIVPHPLVGVSNVWPGLQLADMAAHILGRFGVGDVRFGTWYRLLAGIKAEGDTHLGKHLFGFKRLQWEGDNKYSFRKERAKKKELGPP